MPLYDMACSCGATEEDVMVPVAARHDYPCACGGTMAPVVAPVSVIGPMPSKPVVAGGQTFTRPEDFRAWQRATGKEIIDTKSNTYLRRKESAHKAALRQAKKAGYTSVEEFRAKAKKEI
jgi:hypothetical protein